MRPILSASYGGPGWEPRASSHRQDIEDGLVWRRCGLCSEVDPLRQVVLAWPEAAWFPSGDPNASLFLQWPDVELLQTQASAIASYYEAAGVTVHWVRRHTAPPNYLFQRDLFFMTPEGAILARPASVQRRCEAKLAAASLAALEVPILAVPRGEALFEGADALWLDERTVLIGVGRRTNQAGARCISRVLLELGIQTMQISLPGEVQHLLGVVNFADRKKAVVGTASAPERLLRVLRDTGVDVVHCDLEPESAEQFGANFVTLYPGKILMPAGRPVIRERLRAAGISVDELDVSQYLRGAGGLACLTGILHRGV
jgi:N-dimethylarginine dimethylaminohydrolase